MNPQFNLTNRYGNIRHYYLTSLINLILIVTLSWLTICPNAIALLRQHYEAPNILRYHAQDSIPDSDGNSWQVVLFPENLETGKTRYYLRLVGFPGIKSFAHPMSLEIITSEGNIYSVQDAYLEYAPAPNVGQYDLTLLMPKLSSRESLRLTTMMRGKQELSLKIPSKVIAEWILLSNDIEK